MWITTKSIVKEIKKKQEDLEVKLELLDVIQKDNALALKNQFEGIYNRLENFENYYIEERNNNRNQLANIIKELEELKQLFADLQRKISNVVVEQAQNYSNQVVTSVHKNTETILGKINFSTDKICGAVQIMSDDCEQAFREEIIQTKKESDVNREKYISMLTDTIRVKIEQLEKVISETSTEIVSETRNCSNGMVGEINSINATIKDILSAAANKDTIMSNNIETMNLAMQEIMRNLMMLDEGNRLVIAKLLLKDMEI